MTNRESLTVQPVPFSVAPLPSNRRLWRFVKVMPLPPRRYVAPAGKTIVLPSGTELTNDCIADETLEEPVASIDDGTR